MSGFGKMTIMFISLAIVVQLLGIPTGLSNILSYVGIDISTGIINSSNLSNSNFYSDFFAILATIGGAGAIIVGLFARSYDPSLVVAPAILGVGGFLISTIISLMSYLNSLGAEYAWITNSVGAILILLGVAYLFSGIDYFRSGT